MGWKREQKNQGSYSHMERNVNDRENKKGRNGRKKRKEEMNTTLKVYVQPILPPPLLKINRLRQDITQSRTYFCPSPSYEERPQASNKATIKEVDMRSDLDTNLFKKLHSDFDPRRTARGPSCCRYWFSISDQILISTLFGKIETALYPRGLTFGISFSANSSTALFVYATTRIGSMIPQRVRFCSIIRAISAPIYVFPISYPCTFTYAGKTDIRAKGQ